MSKSLNIGIVDETVHVFVSYAREDMQWLNPEYRFNLIPFLAESLRRQNVAFWFDKELNPGDEFKQRIERQIDQAQIALLIVSQNFLNSEFIEITEMPRVAERARRGEMIVVPVLVEPCGWAEYPFLADRQMVPSSPLIDFTESAPKWAKVKIQILDGLKAQLKRIREVPQQSGQGRSEERLAGQKPVPNGSEKSPHGSTQRRTWAWAAVVVAALLLVAVLAGMHLVSHPAPAVSPEPVAPQAPSAPGPTEPRGSAPAAPARSKVETQGGAVRTAYPPAKSTSRLPAQPASSSAPAQGTASARGPAQTGPDAGTDNAALLTDTMSTIWDELRSIGTFTFTDTDYGATLREQISDVVAEPAECRISFRWRESLNGESGQDEDLSLQLKSVTAIELRSRESFVVASTNSSVTSLNIYASQGVSLILFPDAALANHFVKDLSKAVKLCGGTLAN